LIAQGKLNMKSSSIALLLLVGVATFSVVSSPMAFGHGIPIDVSVDGSNRLTTNLEVYESAFGGSIRTTDLPGISVSTTANGVDAFDQIGLQILQELLFFDGTNLVPATGSVLIENPELSDSRSVNSATGLLGSLYWGEYHGGNNWHEHGQFTLQPSSSPVGAYGLVGRITSPDDHHLPSRSFLIAINNGLSTAQFEAGVAAFQTQMVPEPSSFVLSAIGAIGLLWTRVRRRRTTAERAKPERSRSLAYALKRRLNRTAWIAAPRR